MKKICLIFTFLVLSFSFYSTDAYISDSIKSFINSPNYDQLDSIEDKTNYICEKIFLEAYMRREFSDLENKLCSDIFEKKIEAQMNYIRYVMGKRGIYY